MTKAGGLLAVSAGTLALALLGCGTTEIDHSKAEGLIRQSVTKAGQTVKSVSCPSGVEAKKGGTFTCHLTEGNGLSGTVTIHMTDDSGHIVVRPSDYHQTGG